MKLKDLKKKLDKMSKEELEQELIYNSENYSMSGRVTGLKKARVNLYYTGEDDPAQVYTKKQLKDDGYDEEEIAGFEIEIPKGRYFIEF